MTEFPVPLDNLISYVKALHPEGGPLENVSDAFAVSTQMDEQADALIGYFVDQARRSGLPWSQIGGAMGVSKQAAQKRFVPTKLADRLRRARESRSPGSPPGPPGYYAAAGQLAAPHPFSNAHLAAALLTEPEGVAALVITKEGVTPEELYNAVGTGRARGQRGTRARRAWSTLNIEQDAKEALKGALKWALRLGHNYIGTEHLLLGVLSEDGRPARPWPPSA